MLYRVIAFCIMLGSRLVSRQTCKQLMVFWRLQPLLQPLLCYWCNLMQLRPDAQAWAAVWNTSR